MENGQCLATKTIMSNGAKVGYMFKEASDFDGDSGWRIFTGEESLDFVDQEDNIEVYDIQEIVKVDPSIAKYLDSPIGTELERVGESQDFVEVSTE